MRSRRRWPGGTRSTPEVLGRLIGISYDVDWHIARNESAGAEVLAALAARYGLGPRSGLGCQILHNPACPRRLLAQGGRF